MKARAFFAATLLASLFLAYDSAKAVVRNDDGFGNPGDFPCAVKIGTGGDFFCSGTVICGGRYVITAAHCFERESDLGKDWTVMDQFGNTRMGRDFVRIHPRADLAIICLKGAFDSSYDLYCDDVEDMEVCFTGYGLSSDAAGADGGGPGTGMQEVDDGLPRTGYNILDRAIAGNRVAFDFDRPNDATGLGGSEGTTFEGDSGMGYLKEVNGVFQLLAVHSGGFGRANVYGRVSFGVNVQPHKEWIESKGLRLDGRMVPEPSALALVGIGITGFGLLSRRRRRSESSAGGTD